MSSGQPAPPALVNLDWDADLQALALGSDFTYSGTTNLMNVTEATFEIGASQTKSFEFDVVGHTGTAGGMQFGFTVPSGASIAFALAGQGSSNTTFQADRQTAASTKTATFLSSTTDGPVSIKGRVICGTQSGVVQLQVAAGTSTGVPVIRADTNWRSWVSN
jgi:hypothetical protein